MDKKINRLVEDLNKHLIKLRKKIDHYQTKINDDFEINKFKEQINEKAKKIEELQRIHGENSNETIIELKNLSNLKLKISNQPLSKKYIRALKKYNEVIDYINERIFFI